MIIGLFGASGGTGRAVAAAAHSRRHSVRAFCRAGSSPPLDVGRTVVGALDDPDALASVIRGADAVVCVLGPRPPYREAFCATATRQICAAMASAGVRRLVGQTGAMIGQLRPNVSWAMRFLARRFAASRPEIARDRAEQEAIVAASGLDWTLLKPPRLRDSNRPETLVLGSDVRVGLLSSVSRAALAGAIVDLVESPRFLAQAVYLRRA